MHHALRSALLPALALGLASVLGGCKTNCSKNADGTETCTAETTVPYVGTTTSQQFTWGPGQAVRVGVIGGSVSAGDTASVAISVNVHGTVTAPAGCTDPTQVCVQITPVISETKGNETDARRQMLPVSEGGNLVATIDRPNGDVQVSISTTANGTKVSSSLSARVDVLIPANFDGDLVAKVGRPNGSAFLSGSHKISVIGARRGLDISTFIGDIYLEIPNDVVPAASDDQFRRAITENGDISFVASAAANISVQGVTTGVSSDVVTIDNVSGWYQVEGSTDQSATFCGNTACGQGYSDGNWYLETGLGNVEVALR